MEQRFFMDLLDQLSRFRCNPSYAQLMCNVFDLSCVVMIAAACGSCMSSDGDHLQRISLTGKPCHACSRSRHTPKDKCGLS